MRWSKLNRSGVLLCLFATTVPIAADRIPPVSDGLVSWWTADDGTARDFYGSNHGLLQHGSVVPGVVDKGLYFDGVQDFVHIPNSPSLSITGEITVAAWIKPESDDRDGAIVSKYDSRNYSRTSWALIYRYGEGLMFTLEGPGKANQFVKITNAVAPVGVFTHVAATFAPSRGIRLFINGAQIDAPNQLHRATKAPLNSLSDSLCPVRIGSCTYQDGSLNLFHGVIDEVALFRRALSEQEVRRMAFAPPKFGPLVSVGSLLASGAAVLLGIVGARWFMRRRIRELERQRAAQHAFSRQLIASQENERKRMAAELHDSLGQNLLLIRNLALMGQSDAADSRVAAERFHEVSQLTASTIQEVRNIAYALRPVELDRLGLTKAIAAVIAKVSEASSLRVETALENIDGAFSSEGEIAFYRIVQEGLNNAVKHAAPQSIWVEIGRHARSITLRIQDDGRGFDLSAGDGAANLGLGLKGISERSLILNGQLNIEAAPGRGTVIQLTVPT